MFVHDATTFALTRTISNPTFDSQPEAFGSAVAVSGNTLVVGAPLGHVAANVALGQAYVYDLTTGALLYTLNSAARHFHQLFGISVEVSGGRIAVGSREQVYLFNAVTGEPTATLADPTPTITDNFGVTLALSGDRVLVGAIGDDPNGLADAGRRTCSTPRPDIPSLVRQPAAAAGDSFGCPWRRPVTARRQGLSDHPAEGRELRTSSTCRSRSLQDERSPSPRTARRPCSASQRHRRAGRGGLSVTQVAVGTGPRR